MTHIIIDEVHKAFARPGADRNLLNGISFDLTDNVFTTLVGSNGCGKSTLLQIVAGLLTPDKGHISYGGDGRRPRIGFIWQDYRQSNFPWLDVLDNIAFPLSLNGASRNTGRSKAANLISQFAQDVPGEAHIYQLSGGQQQLVSLLRCVAAEPDFVLADEPFSALDQAKNWELIFKVEELWLNSPRPFLWVSHNLDEAILLADRILLLSRRTGRLADVLENKLPRPRNLKMLMHEEHLKLRAKLIEFIAEERNYA